MLDRDAVLAQQKKSPELGRDAAFFLAVFLIAIVVFGVGAGAWIYAEANVTTVGRDVVVRNAVE